MKISIFRKVLQVERQHGYITPSVSGSSKQGGDNWLPYHAEIEFPKHGGDVTGSREAQGRGGIKAEEVCRLALPGAKRSDSSAHRQTPTCTIAP